MRPPEQVAAQPEDWGGLQPEPADAVDQVRGRGGQAWRPLAVLAEAQQAPRGERGWPAAWGAQLAQRAARAQTLEPRAPPGWILSSSPG